MSFVDKLKQAWKGLRGRARRESSRPKESSPRSDVGNLPGGASAKEAAETNPQRAAELAD